MSMFYNGEHQICFWRKVFNPSLYVVGDRYYTENPKFSWDDFHLIPLTRPFIDESKPHYSVVQIPNSSKRLNITDNMAGGLTYESRTGEWEFVIDHDQWGDWVVSHQALEDFFNGSKMLVALNDDPTKIYEGRITLKDYEAEDSYSKIKMAYDLDPENLPSTALTNVMFRVQFLDKRGNVLQGILSSYGSAPYYAGTVPSEEGQTFDRWSPSPSGISGNIDYKPVYIKTSSVVNTPPVRIEVISLPTKTTFYDGQAIDYSGMVVKAYMENGELWGEVPLGEIEITPKNCFHNDLNMFYVSGNDVIGKFVNRFSQESITVWNNNKIHIGMPIATRNGVIVYTSIPDNYIQSEMEEYEDVIATNYNGGIYLYDMTSVGRLFMVKEDSLINYDFVGTWVAGNKTWSHMNYSTGTFENLVPYNLPSSLVKPSGVLAEGLICSKNTITVTWSRPSDKKILQTTFEINVTEQPV